LTQIASLGQFHVDNLATEVIKGLYEKYEQGGHNGPVPYGVARCHQFDTKGERIKGTEQIVWTDDAPTVELIFTLYATGCYSDATMRDELHGRGLTFLDPKTGNQIPFQRDSVGNILTNPFYIGMVSYKGVVRAAKHPPLISRDLWDAVQAIRQRRTTYRGGRYAKPNQTGLVSEFGFCGACDAPLYYHANSTNGIAYYTCARRRKYGREACDTRMLHAAKHEALIVDLLRMLVIPMHIVDATLEEVERQLQQTPQRTPTSEHATIQRQLDRLRAAYFAGDEAISQAFYRSESARLKALLAESLAQRERRLNRAQALAMMETIGTVLDAATMQERRAVVQQLFDRVWLERGKLTAVRPTGTYLALVEAAAKVNTATSTGLEPATFSSGG
jgi:site-specific DNA recombinase